MTEKSEVSTHIRHFLAAMIERQFSRQVKTIRSDNGTEFTCMKSDFLQQGIVHETSCVGTPQQNGRVERKHRHIMNVARALRFQANLPLDFWGECVLTAAYLINRTPSDVLHGKTPYEILHGKPPRMDHLRVFGCLCFAHNQNHGGDKFASRTRRCVFFGYPATQKGWRVYDLDTKKFLVSRDLIFCETSFPFHSYSPPVLEAATNTPLEHSHFDAEFQTFPDDVSVLVDSADTAAIDTATPVVESAPAATTAINTEPAPAAITDTNTEPASAATTDINTAPAPAPADTTEPPAAVLVETDASTPLL